MMKRYGSVIGLRPEKLDEYVRLHAAVWPDVLKMIRECNIRNYSIYLRRLPDGGHYLFSYFEYIGDDFAADMAKMAADPATQTVVGVLQTVPRAAGRPRRRRMVGRHGRGLSSGLNCWPSRVPSNRSPVYGHVQYGGRGALIREHANYYFGNCSAECSVSRWGCCATFR